MTDKQRAEEIKRLAKETFFGYKVRPHSPRWNRIIVLLDEIIAGATPPPPPSPIKRYAPRAYNTAGGSDARFCMDAKWGVAQQGAGFIDQMGIRYDEGGRDLGGRTKNIVLELKPANEMDDRLPCDPYTGPTGQRVGGDAGYPAGSFNQ